jgi:hypothetical protein
MVSVRLAVHQDIEEQRCIVGYETLASEVGEHERTCIRTIDVELRRHTIPTSNPAGSIASSRTCSTTPDSRKGAEGNADRAALGYAVGPSGG